MLASEYVKKIMVHKPSAVLCQGEMTLAFVVTYVLMSRYGVTVIAACSERFVSETTGDSGETKKQVVFRFTRFRKYST